MKHSKEVCVLWNIVGCLRVCNNGHNGAPSENGFFWGADFDIGRNKILVTDYLANLLKNTFNEKI